MLSEDGVVGERPSIPTSVVSRDICPHMSRDFLVFGVGVSGHLSVFHLDMGKAPGLATWYFNLEIELGVILKMPSRHNTGWMVSYESIFRRNPNRTGRAHAGR